MAINQNTSSEQVIEGRKLVTGVADLQIIAINPTAKEIEKIYGKAPKEEPNYLGTNSTSGNANVRIEVHAVIANVPKLKDAKVRFSFFIENAERHSKTNKMQYINKFGKTTWAETVEDLASKEYYKDEASRPCLPGEENFTNLFLRSAANVAMDGECRVDDWSKVFKGDFSELHNLANVLKTNTFRALLGVRKTDDGKFYQDVYTKWFERSYISSNAKFLAALSEENGQFGSKNNPIDWQNDFTLKEYNPSAGQAPKPDAEKPQSNIF